jgi:hypothetical protein
MKGNRVFGILVLLICLAVAGPSMAARTTATAAGSAGGAEYTDSGERWYGTGTGILGVAAGFGGYLHGGYDRASGGPGIPGFDSGNYESGKAQTSAPVAAPAVKQR